MKTIYLQLIVLFVFFGCSQKDKEPRVISQDINSELKIVFSELNKYGSDKERKIQLTEKANTLLTNIPNDSLKRKYLFDLAAAYYNYEKYEDYLKTSRQVNQLAKESKDSSGIAKSLLFIGDYYLAKFVNDSAYYYYNEVEKIGDKLKKKENFLRVKYWKAYILFIEKDYSGSETKLIGILKEAKEIKDNRLIYDCYVGLGNALEGLENFKQAIVYYNKALEITDQLKSDYQYTALKAQIYNYIAKIYQKTSEHDKAISYLNDGLSFDDFQKNDEIIYANLINNLAFSKIKKNEFPIALKYLDEAYTIRKKQNDVSGQVFSNLNFSEYYLAKKDTFQALAYGKKAQQSAHAVKMFEEELIALNLLAKADLKNSIFYKNRFIELTDSLHNQERATRNKFARIEFETDEIITEKNSIEEEKNKISLQRWMILGSSIVALLLVFLLYLNKIQRARNRQLILEQQQQKANEEIYQLMLDQHNKIDEGRQVEKKRIAQELHDGIMSKLTSTRLNLFILSKRNDDETIKKCLKHIDGIQEIEKEIRAISHDLSRDIFEDKDSFQTIVESLFTNQGSISETKYSIKFDNSIRWENIESSTKMHLYRIFQEALQNIHKYATAKNVLSNITKKEEDTIHIEIIDDGKGFDLKKAKEGIGLKNMKSRVSAVNGSIFIESEINKGTKISIDLPVQTIL